MRAKQNVIVVGASGVGKTFLGAALAHGDHLEKLHEAFGDPTIAEAICDRLVHNAHVVALRGPSMRKKKGIGSEASSTSV